MSYAVRNSIILAVLILIVNGIGWFGIVTPARKQIKKQTAEIVKLDQKIASDISLPTDIINARKAYDDLQKRWVDRTKILPRDENTRVSYSFINGIVQRSSKPFPFDFDFEGQKDTMGLSVRKYALRADVPYADLSNFIRNLEEDKRLMVITELQLDAKPIPEGERVKDNLVTVNAKLVAYSATNGSDNIPIADSKPSKTRWDPFKALVTDKLPRNEEQLLEVDRSRLVAISNGIAYLQDQGSMLISLQEGDAVYLGFVTRIDPQKAQVEFTLNYGGFIRKRVLDLVREAVTGGTLQKMPTRNDLR